MPAAPDHATQEQQQQQQPVQERRKSVAFNVPYLPPRYWQAEEADESEEPTSPLSKSADSPEMIEEPATRAVALPAMEVTGGDMEGEALADSTHYMAPASGPGPETELDGGVESSPGEEPPLEPPGPVSDETASMPTQLPKYLPPIDEAYEPEVSVLETHHVHIHRHYHYFVAMEAQMLDAEQAEQAAQLPQEPYDGVDSAAAAPAALVDAA